MFITSRSPYGNTTTFYHNNFDKILIYYPLPLLFEKKINRLMITLRAHCVAVPMLPSFSHDMSKALRDNLDAPRP
jgi:hypothetical protein